MSCKFPLIPPMKQIKLYVLQHKMGKKVIFTLNALKKQKK